MRGKRGGECHDDDAYYMCLYCGRVISEDDIPRDLVPPREDDEAWEDIADYHEPMCDWVLTRAHRI